MFSSNQNFYSPMASPVKGNLENSPALSSPLKQPRPQTNGFESKGYKPVSKD